MIKSLKTRKNAIQSVKWSVDYARIRHNAYRKLNHAVAFFENSAGNLNEALEWKTLGISARKNHILKFVNHVAGFGAKKDNLTVNFPGAGPSRGALAGTHSNGRKIEIYDQLTAADNYAPVPEVARHEVQHVDQIEGEDTTLSPETVKICTENYIRPDEDDDAYRNGNAMEVEAFETGKIVGRGVMEYLDQMRRMQNSRNNKFITRQNGLQLAA
ncbi:MAG: hypothetical protein FWC51_00290 [Proteobacteria bacterium]|nr:hypothetical protein [Pseudomonadota bacterium]